MLETLGQLSEATEKTATGLKHKADPGGYGRKYDTDEEGDEKKKDAAPAAKRGRGRPAKGSDETGNVKKYDNAKNLQDIMVGNKPKKSKELDKLPAKKHSLKDWFEHMEKTMIAEAEQVTMEPAKQNTQVIKQGTKTLGTVSNPQLAAQIKQSIGKGEMSLSGGQLGEDDTDYSPKKARAGKDIGKPGKQFAKIAKSAGEKYGSKERGEKVAGAILAKLRKTNEADIPSTSGVDTTGAGLGAGRSKTTLEAKAAKPDYIDLDKDGNKKESMKKAASDKKKKEVKEGMSHKLHAARLEGKAHGLKGHAYHGKAFDDLEEMRAYHEGYKEGLDECYGMKPIQGMVDELAAPATPPATVPGMANQAMEMAAMEAEMEEGNLFTGNLAKARAAGKTMADLDGDGDMEKVTEFAFEDLDRELERLLTEGEDKIEEGMSVSISKGQQGMPDTVSVTAQDAEADQLLGLIKTLGGGLFGGEEQHSDYGAPQGAADHGGIKVVDDHEGMLALMKKMSGGDEHGSDYEDEEGHGHEEMCNECGTMMTAEGGCGCDEGKEMVDEVESEDQMEFEVAEDNAPDSEEAEHTADEESEAQTDMALAKAAQQNKTTTVNEEGDEEEGEEGEESEIEESFTFESIYKKIAMLEAKSEDTEEEDEKAEKAGKKVTKDIEYDDKKDKKEKVDEWANQTGPGPGKGTDASFEQDIDFMTKVIAGGLNKPKSTGQTTIPVIAGQNARTGDEDVAAWKKLAGIGK